MAPLLRRAWFSERAFEVALERPKTFEFVPGQNVRLSAGGQERDYSMASGPADSCLSFCVSRVEGGTVSSALWGVPMGSPFAFTGPHGLFTIRESPRRAVWAATGVGIAPFLSMVRAGATGFTLLQGARRFGDLLHRQELEAAASRYVPCLSREAADGCYSGRVTRWAGARLEPGVYDFYLCGMRSMIRDFIRIVDERFPDSRVYTEIFF
ncbi:MAG: ferredoxin--NADP reductase [Spirochaetia bacterium]